MTVPPQVFPPTFLTADATALCAEIGGEAWFPPTGGSARDVKAICHRCELEAACLEWALDTGEQWGIWGGKSPRDRRRILARRGVPVVEPKPIDHGTEAGYKAHTRRGDVLPPNDPCGCRAASRLASNARKHRRDAA